jgi:signal transduction histidine kinase
MRRPILSDTPAQLTPPRGIVVLSVLVYLVAATHEILLRPLGWPAMEVMWAALLIPTVALSFYYGWRGSLLAVVVGLALVPTAEWLSHGPSAFAGEHLVFGASVLMAIIAVGVVGGGLTDLLRGEHARRVMAERRGATAELSLALRHEINNPLAALLMEAELLEKESEAFSTEQRESITNLVEQAHRIQQLVAKVGKIDDPKRIEYLDGRWMTDLSEE